MSSADPFPLASETPFPEDDGVVTVDDGAAGPSTYDGAHVSTGALVAILVIVGLVAIIGISTAALFFVAKKREWTVRETIRRSARRVVTAFTPRARTEFPRELKDVKHAGSVYRREPRFTGTLVEGGEDLEKGRGKHDAKRWGR